MCKRERERETKRKGKMIALLGYPLQPVQPESAILLYTYAGI
jgi:hypothetical protein